MNRETAENLLLKYFGHQKFHDSQWDTIERIINKERILLIEKTGFGKSLCFQFPAIIFEGTTVVFSPLVALMRDQVKKLRNLGINAACINYEQSNEENLAIIEAAKLGQIKILYISPERMENTDWIEAIKYIKLSMIVVDEAHCISVWGHDFRPAFKRIVDLVKLLPKNFPILATTATATKRVENDIITQIGDGISVLRGNLLRENFRLYVIKVNSEDDKLMWLGRNIEKIYGTGILYTGTRVDTEIYAKWFEYLGISSINYNAGLDTDSRISIEEGLINNKWKCVISTNALGMGIDKSDIRFVIHTQIPQSPIHYYQEIGRAGRDGKPANIILFYNPEDTKLPKSFIENSRPSIKKYELVISTIKSELLGEREIIKRCNLKQNQFRVIKVDLIEQNIIREVILGRNKKYEFVSDSKPFSTIKFDNLKEEKNRELDKMIEYVFTKESRMKFLCDFLGDSVQVNFQNCDNTGLKKLGVNKIPDWINKLKEFRENFFPVLEVESSSSNIENGIAASYYGVSSVGESIHRSKYENAGDFPDHLIKLTLKAFRKTFGSRHFDLVLYIPSTKSGDLVKNFSVKIANILKFKISHDLIKSRQTEQQKIFENSYLKKENVAGAFSYIDEKEIEGLDILIIDDIFDSGATIKEVGLMLTKLGANSIVPLTIAKTVGGDSI